VTHNETKIRESIHLLEVISGHPRVAIRLIELSRDSSAEIADYAASIETDPGLASRLLGLVNSAWFAPTSPIETIPRAICCLGLASLRTIAMAHCVTSLHKSMRLDRDDARAMWAGSMCKAIAARQIIVKTRPKQATVAFTMALLQDLGYALLSSIDTEAMATIHRRRDLDPQELLLAERDHFGLDHCQVMEILGHKLALPELYIQGIEAHHQKIEFEELDTLSPIAFASHIASLLPHDTRHWSPLCLEELSRIIDSRAPAWANVDDFLEKVQAEFTELDEQIGDFEVDVPDLLACLAFATEETAYATAKLVAQNSLLTQDADVLQKAVDLAEEGKHDAEQRADQDPLTRLLNRRGWDRRARALVRQADSSEKSIGVAFFDLDNFKEINDTHGHAAGDVLLEEISRRLTDAVRAEDLVCRWGGDEFVVLFQGTDQEDCLGAVKRVKQQIEAEHVPFEGQSLEVSTSAGFVVVNPSDTAFDLQELLRSADELLYQAKQEERGALKIAA
jgi:diguanylate cyclase